MVRKHANAAITCLQKNKRRPAFSLFAHPVQYEVKVQMENCKIERGIAEMPFPPLLLSKSIDI